MIQKTKKNLYGTSEKIKEEEEASSSSNYKMPKHFQNLGFGEGSVYVLSVCFFSLHIQYFFYFQFFFFGYTMS